MVHNDSKRKAIFPEYVTKIFAGLEKDFNNERALNVCYLYVHGCYKRIASAENEWNVFYFDLGTIRYKIVAEIFIGGDCAYFSTFIRIQDHCSVPVNERYERIPELDFKLMTEWARNAKKATVKAEVSFKELQMVKFSIESCSLQYIKFFYPHIEKREEALLKKQFKK